MSTPIVSAAESMFGSGASRANYLVLSGQPSHCRFDDGTERYGRLFNRPPKSLLAVPQSIDKWEGDWNLAPEDFESRVQAFAQAAKCNAKAMLDPFDDGTPATWSLVFRVGVWCDGSFVNRESGGTATMTIYTKLSIVRPTREEIERFGNVAAEVAVV